MKKKKTIVYYDYGAISNGHILIKNTFRGILFQLIERSYNCLKHKRFDEEKVDSSFKLKCIFFIYF